MGNSRTAGNNRTAGNDRAAGSSRTADNNRTVGNSRTTGSSRTVGGNQALGNNRAIANNLVLSLRSTQRTSTKTNGVTIGVFEVILIGIALSADAMSVTICNLVANPHLARSRAVLMPLLFGLFQGLMPTLGYFAGSLAADFIETYSGIIALLILGFIGGKMVWDGLHDDGSEDIQAARNRVSVTSILLQAVATSIDAFAVGVTFAATREPIFFDAAIIALCTFVLCMVMVAIGRRLGERFGSRAQIVGGLVLVAIGIRAFFF